MRTSQRGFGRVIILGLIGALLGLGVRQVDAAPNTSKISWSPCYREFGTTLQCGTLQVPLDHDERGGAAISIALVRLPATDPARRIGSLFVNPGGPGGSGVDFVVFAGAFLFTDEVRERFDIIGFDPRGIGRSTAVRCFGSPHQWTDLFPFPFPFTLEEERIWADANRKLVDECSQRAPRIVDHMATADVARDLDLLREAVGDEKLNFVGYSYGSYLGVTYASLFPDRIRAVVVDGVLDPVAWATGAPGEGSTVPVTTRLHSDSGAQATLEEFFRLCDSGGPNCAFGGSSSSRFAALAARLKTAPIQVTDPSTGATFPFGYADLIQNALISMYDSFTWPAFAELLVFLENSAGPTELGLRLGALQQQQGLITKRGFPHYFNYPEGFPGVLCSDSENPHFYGAFSQAAAAADQLGYFGRIWTWPSSVCAGWTGTDQDRYAGPFNRQTSNPVLVVGTTFDPATRYQGAVTVDGLLPNSSLLTVHGWGHTSIFLSQCADRAISRYLIDLATPAPGTVCEQDFVPFTASLSSSVSGASTANARQKVRANLLPDFMLRAKH